ncbi:MAG: hypothetical protein AB7H77_04995 [Bdellovibrionales bacterium]
MKRLAAVLISTVTLHACSDPSIPEACRKEIQNTLINPETLEIYEFEKLQDQGRELSNKQDEAITATNKVVEIKCALEMGVSPQNGLTLPVIFCMDRSLPSHHKPMVVARDKLKEWQKVSSTTVFIARIKAESRTGQRITQSILCGMDEKNNRAEVATLP